MPLLSDAVAESDKAIHLDHCPLCESSRIIWPSLNHSYGWLAKKRYITIYKEQDYTTTDIISISHDQTCPQILGGHRTAHNAPRQRPNMRGTSLYPMAVPHARQVAKNIAAKQIPNTWPIPRNRSKKSRGLRRNGNTCFRLSGLQALLHLPRFLQWIISHNSMRNGTRIFPCRPAHVIHAQLDLNMSSTTISSNKKIPSIDELPEKELTQLKKELSSHSFFKAVWCAVRENRDVVETDTVGGGIVWGNLLRTAWTIPEALLLQYEQGFVANFPGRVFIETVWVSVR